MTRKFCREEFHSPCLRARPPKRNIVLNLGLIPKGPTKRKYKSLSGRALILYALRAHHPPPFARSRVQSREKPLRLATERSKRAACFSRARNESHPLGIHPVSKPALALRNHC